MGYARLGLCLVGLGEIINAGLTRGTKYLVNERRPDGGKYSFPSGHTANAFLGAHIAYKEFKDSNPWLAYSGYALGLFVAGSRIYNNRHWVADVIAGAGMNKAADCIFPIPFKPAGKSVYRN